MFLKSSPSMMCETGFISARSTHHPSKALEQIPEPFANKLSVREPSFCLFWIKSAPCLPVSRSGHLVRHLLLHSTTEIQIFDHLLQKGILCAFLLRPIGHWLLEIDSCTWTELYLSGWPSHQTRVSTRLKLRLSLHNTPFSITLYATTALQRCVPSPDLPLTGP